MTQRCCLSAAAVLSLFLLFVSALGNIPFGAASDDLYALLGVNRGVTREEVKKAFRSVAREHHPDVQETPEAKGKAKEHMTKVLLAYKVLSDDILRYDYDQFGRVPGEKTDTTGYSSDELFEQFQQLLSIVSETRQLQHAVQLRRILDFRGNRLFLVQVYDDDCKTCRQFAPVWEGFLHYTLVEAGVVELYRINAFSPEGSMLLQMLGIAYNKEVALFGIVDGAVWSMPQLHVALNSGNDVAVDRAVLDFIENFFTDRQYEISSTSAGWGLQAVLNWLRESRQPEDAVRVLLPPLSTRNVPLALSLLYEGTAVVRSVSRATLLDLVEGYCNQSVDALSGRGKPAVAPEFIVVSTELLPDLTSTAETIEGHWLRSPRSCRGIVVGVGATLTLRQAVHFLGETLKPKHRGMTNITHVTSTSFFEVCRAHCLLWLRRNCTQEPDQIRIGALRSDFKPFKVGYACLDNEPVLLGLLHPTYGAPIADVLVALVDGDDQQLYQLQVEMSKEAIADFLSELLRGGNGATSLQVDVPVSRALISGPFQMSKFQYLKICFYAVVGRIHPFIASCYPFLVGLVIRVLLRRFNALGNNNSTRATNLGESGGVASEELPDTLASPSGGTHSSSQRHAKTDGAARSRDSATSSDRGVQRDLRTFEASDLVDARGGRGFLLLFFEHDKPLVFSALPQVCCDPRFTLRCVPRTNAVWMEWLLQQRREEEGCTQDDKALGVDGVYVAAIRQGKMLAAVKPLATPLESWLLDLLDGTVVAKACIPLT
ncbi:DnaJ domain [Trypanosoma vivax]|uniref:Putative DNAJ domain protein n=1 Tax=Trypanosoma vivax (strain Y486) TaxID=1055687 RepID=G0UB71_TRYVY|nr:DnaJ domain [Trypanosoma vivax]CCC53058.1 putative DNAJ domain protein [Trypanosoma vivax Y486]